MPIDKCSVVSCSTTGHVGSDGAFTISWNNGQPYVSVVLTEVKYRRMLMTRSSSPKTVQLKLDFAAPLL